LQPCSLAFHRQKVLDTFAMPSMLGANPADGNAPTSHSSDATCSGDNVGVN